MRKVRKTLGVYTNTELYAMKVPGRKKRGLGRTVNTCHVYNSHEQMKDDLEDNPGLEGKLEEAIASRSLPDCYFEHPVVVEHGQSCPVYPIGFFADGLPYTQTDSLIGWWVVNLLTEDRYLVCTLRKKGWSANVAAGGGAHILRFLVGWHGAWRQSAEERCPVADTTVKRGVGLILHERPRQGFYWDSGVLSFISREIGQNTQGRMASQRGPTDSDLVTNAILLLKTGIVCKG